MKAKSKVLLGLIVALAMMVMAVPAFAQELSFTVSDPTPADGVTAYVGDEKATFTFDITENDVETGDTYAVTLTDKAPTGKTAFTGNMEASAVKLDSTGKATVTVTIKKEALVDGAKGAHTVSYVVKKTRGGTDYTAPAKTCAVTVKEMPTATLDGDKDGEVSKDAGQTTGLKISATTPADETNVDYKWQMSKTTTITPAKASDPAEDTEWGDISGESLSTLQKAVANEDNGKYVRCVVNIGGKDVVAKTADVADDPDTTEDETKAGVYAIKLNVNDPTALTVKLVDGADKDAKDQSYFVGQKLNDAVVLKANVTGGTAAGKTYEWYKNGEKMKNEPNESITVKAARTAFKEEDTATYKCVVKQGTLEGNSNEVKITVNKTPTLVITEATAAQKAAGYKWNDDNNKFNSDDGRGNVLVNEADLANELTLTAKVEGMEIQAIEWYKNDSEDLDARGNTSYTIPANTLDQPGAVMTYKAKVYFKGFDIPTTFVATIVKTEGTLTGKTLVSTDGMKTITTNPTYTITLPAGVNFQANTAEGVTNLATLYSKLGVNVVGQGKTIKSTTPITVEKLEVATPDKGAVLEFKHGAKSQGQPVVFPMEVTVKGLKDGEQYEVILPIDPDVGYNVTLPAEGWTVDGATISDEKQVNLDGATRGAIAQKYNGKAVEATVKVADGVGEASSIRYLDWTGKAGAPAAADIAKATTDAPKDAGTYLVLCNVDNGQKYGKADDLVAGKIVISQVTNKDDVEKAAKDLFVIDPASKVFNGQEQTTTVKFADGVTGAGEIDKVTYKDANDQPINPKAVGKYKVFVTTKSTTTDGSDVKNVAEQKDDPIEVGTFEITKVPADAKNYTVDPAQVTYDGTPREAVVKVADGAGEVTAKYYTKDGSTEVLKEAPTEAGVYKISVDTKENDTYAAGEKLEVGTFTIKENKADQQDIYMIGHVQDIGWGELDKTTGKPDGKAVKLEAGKTAQVGTTGQSKRIEAVVIIVPADYTVEGFAHVQDYKDQDVKKLDSIPDYITNASDIPKGYVAYQFGIPYESKRVEAVNIGIKDANGKYVEGFEYATHVQNQGWLGTVRNGSFSGSRGQSLRMEALRFYYDDQVRRPTDIDAEAENK